MLWRAAGKGSRSIFSACEIERRPRGASRAALAPTLFRANYACGICARTPWRMPQCRVVWTRRSRAPGTGVTGPKQT